MAISVNEIKNYVEHDMNVFISGERGTGKTQMSQKAVELANKKAAYFSTPTFDPYVEVMGVPVPRIEEGKKAVLEFVKVAQMDDVEVILLDELNRASSETLNMVFEIIDSGTVNGSRLGKVKSIIAMINPNNGDYIGVSDLDPALLDRFDVFIESSTSANLSHMKTIFPADVAFELVKWHREHERVAKNGYISPRRLEKIGSNWMKIQTSSMIASTLPPGVTAATKALHLALVSAISEKKSKPVKINSSTQGINATSDSRSSTVVTSIKKNSINLSNGDLRLGNIVFKYENMNEYEIRGRILDFKKAFENENNGGNIAESQMIVETVLRGYVTGASAKNIISKIDWALDAATDTQIKTYMMKMTSQKRQEMKRTMKYAQYSHLPFASKF